MELLFYNIIQLISLGLSVVALYIIFGLLQAWHGPAKAALRVHNPNKQSSDWIILGIYLSFAGQFIDITYWQIGWSSYYINSDSHLTRVLFEYGTIPNIFFRQGIGIAAAILHLIAANMSTKPSDNIDEVRLTLPLTIKNSIKNASIIGVIFVIIMVISKRLIL